MSEAIGEGAGRRKARAILAWAVWALLTLGAVAFIGYSARSWIRIGAMLDQGIQQRGASTAATGVMLLENDSYYWLSFANRIANGETWRVRDTDADNAPYGREVHWSQSVSWLLAGSAKIRQAVTGETTRMAIEKVSVWLNPALLALFTVGIGWALFGRMGAIPAALFELYLVTQGNNGWTFHPLRPDHQTLHSLFGVSAFVGVILGGAGWVRSGPGSPAGKTLIRPLEVPDLAVARRWFVSAGVLAGLGLWVSAAVQGILLLLLLGGGIFLVCFAPSLRAGEPVRLHPELWRWWGWACGATSLFFYLVEYFPAHLALRMEVNNPVYSVAAVLIGESLCRFLRARTGHARRASFLVGICAAAAVLAIPAVIILGPPDWHAMRDPQMFRMHRFIEEFNSYPQVAGAGYGFKYLQDFGVLPFFLLATLVVIARCRVSPYEWAALWLTFALTYGVLGLSYLQVRWIGIYAAMNILLAVVVGTLLWSRLGASGKRGRPALALLLLGLALAQPLWLMARQRAYFGPILAGRNIPADYLHPVMQKRVAEAFAAAVGPGARVMASPSIAPLLFYFADAHAVTSLYWENKAGLHAATAFFTDPGEETALEICRSRGITHVLILGQLQLKDYFSFLATGTHNPARESKTVAARLRSSQFSFSGWLDTTANLERVATGIYFYHGKSFEVEGSIYRVVLPPR